MKQTRIVMGMPVTVSVVASNPQNIINQVFDYFKYIDNKFSTYKKTSEISRINRGEISLENYSEDMKTVFALSEKTKRETDGYFDIIQNKKINPSGLVKGWAILNASKILKNGGFEDFYIEAGGDIQASGRSWRVGVRNPFNKEEVIKVLLISSMGVATSGTYERGFHIYNPKKGNLINEIISLTVIGPNIYEADRFCTAAFAMGKKGIKFIQSLKGFEGYMIDKEGLATYTNEFEKYEIH